MVTKKPSELELSVLSGYKPPAKTLHYLRRDIRLISQLTKLLRIYKSKKDPVNLRRCLNIAITLTNVFETQTLEYAMFAMMPNELWPEAATLLFALKINPDTKHIDADLAKLLHDMQRNR